MRRALASLRARGLLLIVLALVPVISLTVYASIETQRADAARVEETAWRLARLAADHQAGQIDGMGRLLAGLARVPAVRDGAAPACSSLLADILTDQPRSVGLGVADLEGNMVCGAVPLDRAVNIADRDYFRLAVATRGLGVGGYENDPARGIPSVGFGYPILNAAGEPVAVVVASIDLAWFDQFARADRLPNGAVLTVFDRHGGVLARSEEPERWVGQTMPNAPLTQAVLLRDEGTAELEGLDGLPRLYAFAPVGDPDQTGLRVTIGITRARAFDQANLLLTRHLFWLIVTGSLALALAWLGIDRLILSRAQAIGQTAERLSTGDLAARTGLRYGSSELDDLARAVDSMAESLQQRSAQLKSAETRYASLLDMAPDAIVAVDAAQRVTLFNKGAEHVFGYQAAEILGQPLTMLLLMRPTDWASLSGHGREITAHRKDGRAFPTEVSFAQSQHDGRMMTTVILRDITERKRIEAELRGAKEELELRVAERTAALSAANASLQRELGERQRAEAALQKTNTDLASGVVSLQQRTREISLLSDMSDLLQACRTPAEAYVVITETLRQLFPTESGALYIVNPARNLITGATSWGALAPVEVAFTPEECWALRRGQPHVSLSRSGLNCQHVESSVTAICLCAPMMAQGEMLGVLHLRAEGEEPLSEVRQHLAATVAKQIGLALANITLRETLRSQSIRDSLTGLYNRRYIEESLDRELARAERNQQPVGFIMLDVDHFKRFNDTFGHDAGDVILRELAGCLKSSIRASDIICRYGGEEILLVLPDANPETTVHRAEQIRSFTSRLRIPFRDQMLGPITISAGVSTFPEHGARGPDLIQAADMALYQAKADGRNRVVVAGRAEPALV